MTKRIIRDYFGIDPPEYQVLSATLFLPLPTFPATDETLKSAKRLLRDLHWNPQYYIELEKSGNSSAVQLIAEKEKLIRYEPPTTDHEARRQWFRALQQVNDRLRPFVRALIPSAEENVKREEAELEANRVLKRRDYAWVLYPEEVLRPFLQQFLSL